MRLQTGRIRSSRSRRPERRSNLSGRNQDHALSVDEQDFARALDLAHDLIFGELLQVEGGEQDEFQLRGFRAYGICDLQHRYPRQPAERRLQRDDPGRGLGLPEIFAIAEIEAAVALQRVQNRLPSGSMVSIPVNCAYSSRTAARKAEHAALSRVSRSRARARP